MRQSVAKSVNPAIPAIFVGLALVAVTIVPLFIERHISHMRDESVRMTDPVRLAVREIQFYLVLETAGTRAYLLTGDATYAAKHHEARLRRIEEVDRLLALSQQFPEAPELRRSVLQLRAHLAPADATLDSLYSGALTRPDFVKRLPLQQARLEATTRTVREIGNSMSRIAAEHLTQIHQTQVIGVVLTLILVVIGGVAALMVARLMQAYRRLAEVETQTRAEAERVADSRSRLMRGFTHDVKNPLSAAAAHLSLIASGVEDPDTGLVRINRAVNNALRLVDELVNLARAETGDITIQLKQVDIGEVVRQAADNAIGLVRSKALWMHLDIPPDLPLVETDADRVQQIIDNLLSNAVKYTHSGGVSVKVRVQVREGNEAVASIAITDTGPGLSAEDRAQLFQEFRRLRTAAGSDGSGLGLAISQRLAHALGGEIVVESEVGKGSCFELVLPCRHGAAAILDIPIQNSP